MMVFLGFTDTCQDIEALQKELRKVGCLETFDSSNNFTFEETSALGEFADTRNKESTATTVGGTGRTRSITAGDKAATLSELNNRHLALGTNSSMFDIDDVFTCLFDHSTTCLFVLFVL